MLYPIDSLKRDVRVALDRNNVSEQLIEFGDIDTLTVEEIIESKIPEAIRRVETKAPLYLLDTGKSFAESIEWGDEADSISGRILLPDDFLRLICFKMSDWSRSVNIPIDETSPLYPLQHSRFPGIRGSWQKPIVAVCNIPGGHVLEFYSCRSRDAKITMARYVAVPVIERGQIGVSEKLKEAAVYMAAALTAQALNDTNAYTALLNNSNELMI